MNFPDYRPRRLRKNENLRRMIRETRLSVDDLVCPLFVTHGSGVKVPIDSMPGQLQLSIDHLIGETQKIRDLGIPAILLFGIPETKDEQGSGAWIDEGIIQQAVRRVKDEVPDILVITDVCLCEYTSHGHCGVLDGEVVDNDASIELLARTALSHARAGADMVAPSAMMDGQVLAIRDALDGEDFEDIPIMAYAAKYASCFYGPFREAAEGAPQFGDRTSYQMDPPNAREALREIALDVAEGADIIMVKPALPYLDIIRMAKDEFDLPLAAYNVSGEYAMIKAADERGWLDGKRTMLESLVSIKRAGADIIITYFAQEAAELLR